MAIRTSSCNSDIYKDDVFCDLDKYTINEKLFALQNLNKIGM